MVIILLITGAPPAAAAAVAAGFICGSLPIVFGRYRRRGAQPGNGTYIIPLSPPPPPRDFEGRRTELQQIHDACAVAPRDKPALVLITGPAGIGKTALAAQFAHLSRDLFPDGQVFARLGHSEGEDSPADVVLGRFVRALQLLREEVPGGHDALERRFAELTAGKRVLFIIDDACHAGCLRKLVPSGPYCAVVVTSRAEGFAEQLPEAVQVALKPLSTKEAVRLLESAVGSSDVRDRVRSAGVAADRIAGSGHPLAVRLAAAALASRPYFPLEDALTRMQDQRPLPATTPEAVRMGRLDLSYALLTEQERKAFMCLGLLGKPVVAPWELAALLDAGEQQAIHLADNLAQEQLIRRTDGGRAGVVEFSLHDHVLGYARARMQTEMLVAEQTEALSRLATERTERRRRADGLGTLLHDTIPEWSNEGLLAKALDEARDALVSARENDRPPQVALALATIADLQAELGNTNDAQELAEAARAVPGVPAPPRALRCLGRVMLRNRQLTPGLRLLAEAVTAARDTGDQNEEVLSLAEQAVTLALAGESSESLAVADRAVQRSQDGPQWLYLSAAWARGHALVGAGRLVEAAGFLAGVAGGASAEWELYRAWISLLRGRIAVDLGEIPAGIGFADEAIGLFGGMAHRYAAAHCRLLQGRAYAQAGDLVKANASLSEALETFQNCDDPYWQAETKRILAAVMFRQDQRHEGRLLLSEAERSFALLNDDTSRQRVRDELASHREPWWRFG
ncbi:MAG TPA: NB-ARC domain-containing protein, partial [Streptosporangiaceae bacterium]